MGKMNYDDEFYCCRCGNRWPMRIGRKQAQQRESGHLKKLFCFYCDKEVNFCEIQPFAQNYTYNDFRLEFNYHNFDSEQNRKMPYGEFKNKLVKEGVDIYE